VAADKDDLEKLHASLATTLASAITQKDENGGLNASVLNVARQFLKDNGIQARSAPGTPLAVLKEAFPFDEGKVVSIQGKK